VDEGTWREGETVGGKVAETRRNPVGNLGKMPFTRIGRNTNINKTVTWIIHRLEEYGACKLEAVATGIPTLCHIMARFLKWNLPIRYKVQFGYVWVTDMERRSSSYIKPVLTVIVKAKEDYWEVVKDGSFVRPDRGTKEAQQVA